MGQVTVGQAAKAALVSLIGAILGLLFDHAIAYLRQDWTNPVGLALVVAVGVVPGVFTLLAGARRREPPPNPYERWPRRQPRRVPVLPIMLVIVLAFGGGVGLLTYGGHYLGAWITGDEEGTDILVATKSAKVGALTLTVDRIRHTRHFTRVDLTASNTADPSLSLPVFGYSQLTPARGTTMEGHPRSDWPTDVPGHATVRGTLNFDRLPAGTIKLNVGFTQIFGPGGNSIIVRDVQVRA